MSTLTGIPSAEGNPAHTIQTVRRCRSLANRRGVVVRWLFVLNLYRCFYVTIVIIVLRAVLSGQNIRKSLCRGVSGGDLGASARARVKTATRRWGPVAGERGN